MAEGWKQVWDDLRNALRGEPQPEPEEKPTESKTSLVALEVPAISEPNVVNTSLETPIDETYIESVLQGSSDASTLAAASENETSHILPEAASTESSAETLSTPPMTAEAPIALPGVVAETIPPPVKLLPRWRKQLSMVANVLLIGALVIGGLWSAGGNRLWAQLTAPKPPAPDVVATYDGGQITVADLEAHFKVLTPEEYRTQLRTPENLRFVVREMVTDILVRAWASKRQPDKDQNFTHTMQHITESINLDSFNAQLHGGGISVSETEIQAYYEANKAQFGNQPLNTVREEIRKVLVEQKESQYLKDYIARLKSNASITRDFALLDVPPPSDADLRNYYEANQKTYALPAQFTVDMLTFPVGSNESAARAAADKALLQLRSGTDFASITTKVPEAQVTTNSTLAEDKLETDWIKAVSALQPGETSDIFRAGNTLYIVRLIKSQATRVQSFDEVRPKVLEAVQSQRTAAWMKDNGAKTLFTIKGKQYSLGQFYSEYQELPPQAQAQFAGTEGMKKLAEALIDRLVLVEDTYDQLLDVKNKDLIDQTRLDFLKQMLEQEEVDDKLEITDVEIQR